MAFLRRRGNAYYLVHNVRRAGKVKQLHLACLGDRPLLTDSVIRAVRRSHPRLSLNWKRLRMQMDDRVALLATDARYLRRLAQHLHGLNQELADLAPQLLRWGSGREAAAEFIALLRLLRSTVEAKLREFGRGAGVAQSRGDFRKGGRHGNRSGKARPY